ncbi:hypothetical protein [Amycolatopsis sp. NPDC004169]|uniref:hypothetical protein n=1 Tax=Amycolatopsis sp. NPDC004169 TaxID=3154453 RepID=UPI0033A604CD
MACLTAELDAVPSGPCSATGRAPSSLGVAGRFWKPVITWRRVEADDFAAFDDPGFGKLVRRPCRRAHRMVLPAHTRSG